MSTETHHGPSLLQHPPERLDYSLTGKNATKAIEMGLAEAEWYQTDVPREKLRALLERRDDPPFATRSCGSLCSGSPRRRPSRSGARGG